MAKFEIQFPYSIRQGLQVASAIAEAVANNVAFGRPWDGEKPQGQSWVRPVLLAIRGEVESPVYVFEGGTVVKVSLANMANYRNDVFNEDWVVGGAEVKYYQLLPNCSRASETKISEIWGLEVLRNLQRSPRGWWHPNVVTEEELDEIFSY